MIWWEKSKNGNVERDKKTFEKLKNKFTRELILAILDLDKK